MKMLSKNTGLVLLLAGLLTACGGGSGESGTAAASSQPAAVMQAAKPAASGSTFYVATSGSDSNAGSLSAPWRTIGHAAGVLKAGQTALVRGGTYAESVTLAASGNAASGYITLQNYPGETPILDGTTLKCCGGTINGLFNVVNKSYVVINGFEIRNYKSTTASDEPVGILVQGSGSNIQLLNNNVHNITTTAEKNNGNAHGIGIYGTATTPLSNIVVSGNQVHNLATGWSESMTLDGNVTNFTVTNNIVHDNDNIGIDVAGFWGMGPTGHDQTNNGLISGNVVYNISSIKNPAYGGSYGADGIYCDGCAQVVIERNLVYASDLNIEAASENSGHVSSYVTIRDNVVYNPNLVDISIGGYASNVGGSDHVTVVNNTMYNQASNAGNDFQVQYYATNNVFKNNIVYSNSSGSGMLYSFTTSEANPVAMDYNIYFSSAGSANSSWLWNNKTYTGFAAYKSGSGQDAHSIFADPKFISLSTPNLHVAANSPAVNAGTSLGSAIVGTFDYVGNARVIGANIDIGAYEQ